jgi:hypothetical protein
VVVVVVVVVVAGVLSVQVPSLRPGGLESATLV